MSIEVNKQCEYDPLAATVLRLGLPGGIEFLREHLQAISNSYGEVVAKDLEYAVVDSDLRAANRFAKSLVDDFQYKIIKNNREEAEIRYSGSGINGNYKQKKAIEEGASPIVLAVLGAAEGIVSRNQRDADLVEESAAEPRM